MSVGLRVAIHLALVALLAGLGTLLPRTALAHAVLLRADPPSGRTLAAAPDSVRLLFSEPLDAKFSRVLVLDDSGKRVDGGDSRVEDMELLVSLSPGLPNGVYTVRWRSLSSIDLHPESGEYRLFVGVPALASDAVAQRSETIAAAIFTRWWLHLAISVFAGALVAWKLVLAPVLSAEPALRQAALARAQWLSLLAGGLLLVGTLLGAVSQAAQAAGVPLEAAFGEPLRDLLTRGRFASIWWPRLGLSVVAVGIVTWRGLDDPYSESAAVMAPAILLTTSLGSHAAALPFAALGVALDWLHALAAAVWVGGLLTLAAVAPVLKTQPSLVRRVVRGFTRMALVAVIALVLSGVPQAVIEVGSWQALLRTPYGHAILTKVILLAAMLALALRNQRRANRAHAALDRGLRLEIACGIVALAVAALVAGTTPPRQISAAGALATVAGPP
ncbi:MAG: copper resistance protein CopC/CopD [Chloroflexota bacterium]|nr:copper resistance protein CopC/CopD [Chloroflexota bacterium]